LGGLDSWKSPAKEGEIVFSVVDDMPVVTHGAATGHMRGDKSGFSFRHGAQIGHTKSGRNGSEGPKKYWMGKVLVGQVAAQEKRGKREGKATEKRRKKQLDEY
jgi:hypothetical protein